jgi:hypothetical protein
MELHTRGVSLQPDNMLASFTVDPEIVFERSAIPEIPIEEFVTPETVRLQIAADAELRRRQRISVLMSSQ